MSNERHTTTAGRIAAGLIVLLALSLSGTASAKTYFVAGGGGQLAIGGGLPLPIQLPPSGTATTLPTAWSGNNFPPLLIPVAPGATISGTTANTVNQQIVVPAGVLNRPAAPNTVGQGGQNPTLFAVRTDLAYSWPAAAATLNTANRPGAATTTYTESLGGALSPASSVVYVAPPTGKFGGPAQFRILPGASTGFIPVSPVTVFAKAVPSVVLPCTHTALTPVPFPGPGSPACVAALLPANPNTLAQVGATVGSTASTLPVNPVPGVGIGKFGPSGDVTFFTFTPAGTMAGPTNMATSAGFPFTVGQLQIKAPAAAGAPETFTISGNDNRTTGGQGTIQLVAASVSQRTLSGPNANRGWVSLTLTQSEPVPTMNEWARIATIGFMAALTVGFFAVRRRGEAL